MSLRGKMNLRISVVAGIVLFLAGWPIYTYISVKWHDGQIQHGEYLEVDLKSMGFFEMDSKTAAIEDVPKRFRELEGKKVLLKGQIYRPSTEFGRFKDFMLVYSIPKSHSPPKVQERVFATVNKDADVKWEGSDIYYDVLGRIHITMKRDSNSNEIIEVYRMDVEKISPSK